MIRLFNQATSETIRMRCTSYQDLADILNGNNIIYIVNRRGIPERAIAFVTVERA